MQPEEVINRPSHYTQYTGFEVMDVCRQMVSPDATPASTWYRGNVFKYLARAGWKNPDKELEDLKKAHHYLEREMDRVKTRDKQDEGWLEQGADPTPSYPTLSGGDFTNHKPIKFITTCGNEGCIEHTEEVVK